MLTKTLSACIHALIHFYQRFINPALKAATGSHSICRFHPTCSNYFLEAVKIHGPFRGSWLGICRIFRCHPWGKSGEDPVPPKK